MNITIQLSSRICRCCQRNIQIFRYYKTNPSLLTPGFKTFLDSVDKEFSIGGSSAEQSNRLGYLNGILKYRDKWIEQKQTLDELEVMIKGLLYSYVFDSIFVWLPFVIARFYYSIIC